ncbi:hypothetical protein PoB_003617200 [Plakobranchus ocellatus]|uniref:Uncharacterized protein n=1 Tax=Plakobranchus ocellatus TaxID=259542 RepID=A0AAV4AQS3_9GAST|nr:hypothetical protein PoB_003617200 [Plakobranchus ocellatus]
MGTGFGASLKHGPESPIHQNCRLAQKADYRCNEGTDEEFSAFNDHFYSHTKKIDQDNFIINYLAISKTKTQRARN